MPLTNEKLLSIVRESFINNISKWYKELITLEKELQQNKIASETLEKILFIAHKSSGSGLTFGFPDISTTGKELESFINTNKSIELKDLPILFKHISLLKIAIKEVIDQWNENSNERNTATENPLENQQKILIVDDDNAIALLIESHLKNLGFQVEKVFNGQECLEKLTAFHPDLIILDWSMPIMSGEQVLCHLKENQEEIPTLLLTANAEEETMIKSLEYGIVDYISKPFDINKLIEESVKILNRTKIKILIVDDDENILTLVKGKLQQEGFHVITATDGNIAYKLALEQNPQMIILDYMIPGINGIAVLQLLKKMPQFKTTPVIMLTAKQQEQDMLEVLSKGAADYITKPFMLDVLVVKINNLLHV